VAIVTGSRRGIGKAIALALARAGADITVCDLVADDGELDEVGAEIRRTGRSSLALQIDVSLKAEVEKLVRLSVEKFGKIDILVNCAGVWLPGQTLLECSEENWDKVIDTNLKSTYLCCQAVVRSWSNKKRAILLIFPHR